MRVLVYLPGPDWATRRAAAIEAERCGFDGILIADHLAMYGVAHREAFTTMGALAEVTRTTPLYFGVLSATFRAPALVARAVLTLHEISSGRIHAGLGAGVDADEHRATGIPFGPPGERLRLLEDTAIAIKELCGDRVPIVIGSSGDRALEIVARHADEWNCGAVYLDRIHDRLERMRRLTARRERPLRFGFNMPIVLSPPQDPAAARRYNLDLALHGDIDAMIERLREIRALGFDTVWLGARSADAFARAVELLPHAKEL